MKPLLFVNWASLAARFTLLMWIVALVLATVVLVHLIGHPAAPPAADQVRPGTSTPAFLRH